ncbi:enhancer of mRNA-decapping protein 4-like [Magnolia sinica]|uniref:enhancer of mRNA-decapping protein 4-like n=1 Tax=Magnolia sinica TaxID=86752 RepID=UPI00265B38DA|nr:enhancer of mRNA-decapping protein 4-like [Magnolia sinica]
MASSAGNPNQQSPYDMQRLFNPSPPNPTNPPSSYALPPSYTTPPPPGPFSYPPPTTPTPPFHHYLHYPHQDPLANMHQHRPISYPTPSPLTSTPNPNPNPSPGARLMALLTPTPPSNLDPPPGLTPTAPMLPPVSSAGPLPTPPARVPSSKLPKGRHLIGDRVAYDVDVRLPGEGQPQQLEVTPITKYVSDPGLVVGRQIAVNRTYICYGLKLGAIRVLNINTALRSLLRGHTQRVTDMAFFAEDVHLLASASVDGRIFVWKINEGPDEEDKPQITGKAVVAIQILGDGESVHPRICWHSHKQEVLVIGIGNYVVKIDTTKVGKGKVFSAEEPLKCPVEKLIDGVQLVGKHDGEVTDLSMCQWMTTRLVSASKDGTVKIWEDRKALPLLTLRPHDGQPVNSVTFLTAPHRPEHIVLITAGHLNREVKVWASASPEGWLLPSDAESWQCTQTLELRSSAEPRAEEAFFNQVVALPHAGLILLANAKKNAIYAIHLDYGPYPSATRMDYITEFTVTMPILSLTGTSDTSSDGEHVVQIYCVQTQAIQQYALDLSQCLPPPMENLGNEKDSSISHVFEAPSSSGFNALEPPPGNAPAEMPIGSSAPKPLVSRSDSAPAARYPIFSGAPELPSIELATSSMESRPSALLPPSTDAENIPVASPPLPLSPRLSGRLSGIKSPSNGFEPGPPRGDRGADQPVLDYSVDAVLSNMPDVPSSDDSSGKDETKVGQNDISMVPNPPIMFKHPTHLITPAEILSTAVSSSENTHITHGLKGGEMEVQDVGVSNDVESVEVEVKVVGESGLGQHEDFDPQREERVLCPEKRERTFYTQASDLNIDMARECSSLPTEILSMEENHPVEDVGITEDMEQPPNGGEDEVQGSVKDGVPGSVAESATVSAAAQSPSSAVKGKKPKEKTSQNLGPSSVSPSPFNSTDSSNEPGSSSSGPMEAALCQIMDMQNQMMTLQKEMLKQMTATVAVPVNKEGRRVETALGRSIEKAVKANTDALWARIQEENAKQKLERDRIQQIMSSISNWNKDLPALLEKTLKKEISSIGPAVARTITPIIEKIISSAIAESFQRGVGDKAVGQLEKSVSSKLEATVARQIQAQFQTSGKQALQDTLRSSLESSLIPAFEMSCKAMFEQVDAVFQKGMVEHLSAAQQQFEVAHSPLAHALRDAMSSATSLTRTLSSELADGQRKILALMAAGANQSGINPLAKQQSNGPLAGLHDMVEPPLDPKKELQVLINERKVEEAFTAALQRSDVSIVSWLCSQVDLAGILSTVPLPLSQGVLLALLQQVACDLANEMPRKLEWMRDVAIAINPVDPMIAVHVRPIFEQVYQILGHQRTVPTTTAAEANSIRLVMHVINSVLMSSCK